METQASMLTISSCQVKVLAMCIPKESRCLERSITTFSNTLLGKFIIRLFVFVSYHCKLTYKRSQFIFIFMGQKRINLMIILKGFPNVRKSQGILIISDN